MEKLGVPAVTVCTDAFIGLARQETRNLGLPDLALAIVRHPLGGESAEVVAERAQDALDQVVRGLTSEAS